MVDQKEWSNRYLAKWKLLCRRRSLKGEDNSPLPDKKFNSVEYHSRLRMALDAIDEIFKVDSAEEAFLIPEKPPDWVPGKKTRRRQKS